MKILAILFLAILMLPGCSFLMSSYPDQFAQLSDKAEDLIVKGVNESCKNFKTPTDARLRSEFNDRIAARVLPNHYTGFYCDGDPLP